MRSVAAVHFAIALLGLGAAPRPASAGATVDLLFIGSNGTAIAPTDSVSVTHDSGPGIHAGDTLTMAVLMTNDEPLTGAFFSLSYDLDGDDHLDIVSAIQWHGVAINKAGTAFFAPVARNRLSKTQTLIGTLQGFPTNVSLRLPAAGGAYSGGYQMGTVVWRVNGGAHGESAELLSVINPGFDIFADGGFNEIDRRVRFNTAAVNFVPESSSAALLGLALAALALARRRSA